MSAEQIDNFATILFGVFLYRTFKRPIRRWVVEDQSEKEGWGLCDEYLDG